MGTWFLLGALIVLGSALWAAYDATTLQMEKYQGGTSPAAAFFGIVVCWIVFFPLYLLSRARRVAGELSLKPEYSHEAHAGTSGTPAEGAGNRPIEERLAKLKQLHANGHIGDAEYNERRRSILNDL